MEKTNATKSNSFKDLKIWQNGMDIVKTVQMLTSNFPDSELYSLTAEIKKTAMAIPSLIAGGYKRFGRKGYLESLQDAQSNVGKLETQLTIAKELDYTTADELAPVLDKLDHTARMLYVYLRKVSEGSSNRETDTIPEPTNA